VSARGGGPQDQQRAHVLSLFENIRVFQRGTQRAVHKPLLVLFNLARVARGEPRLIEFAKADEPLKRLLTEFGPTSAPASRHYPFWHLGTDNGGQVWQLEGPASVINRPAGATPNLGELRREHIRGGFPPALDAALRADRVLLQEIAQRILSSHFPESLHFDILDAVGLDPRMATTGAVFEPERRRNPGFRERVLRAYEYRCCVCGFDLRIGSVTAGLEAAHIQWFQANGPDIESNGLALCALHHKIFDLGVYTVLPGTFTIAFSQHAAMSDATKASLLGYHGAGIVLPQSKTYLPDALYLEWHRDQVFKKPMRE
jgi:putative restriction endonuclease